MMQVFLKNMPQIICIAYFDPKKYILKPNLNLFLTFDFSIHVTKLHADTDAGFSQEYGDIQKYCLKQVKASFEHSSHPDNKCENRYLNIVACKLIILTKFEQVLAGLHKFGQVLTGKNKLKQIKRS